MLLILFQKYDIMELNIEKERNVMSMTTLAYNCPNCGAELYFNADKQKMCCEFCLSEYTDAEIKAAQGDVTAKEKAHNDEEFCAHMDEYVCPNCGAEVIADENTAASICTYCHSPVVLKGKLSGQFMPDKIVPFAYGKDEAINKFRAFIKKRWFLPRNFAKKEQLEKISGIYYPFWVTDADTYSEMAADCTKVRTWVSGDTRYRETSYYKAVREGEIHFEDIVTSAISDADKQMLEGILPFPSDALQPFSMTQLSGFTAKKRDIERSALSNEVREKMNVYAQTLLFRTVNGYTTRVPRYTKVSIHKSHWEYALMPIWLLTYKTRKRTYTYAMNGHTGKIYGELPISIKKLLLACSAVFAAVSPLIALMGGMFL